jgi:hypothetical protein
LRRFFKEFAAVLNRRKKSGKKIFELTDLRRLQTAGKCGREILISK